MLLGRMEFFPQLWKQVGKKRGNISVNIKTKAEK
jgi:hypothetical protein